MQNFKVKQLKIKLKKQWDFFNVKSRYDESEILNWVADSVILLTEIGVNNIIIKAFIETFELVEVEGVNDEYNMLVRPNKIRKLGTFVCRRENFEPWGSYEDADSSKSTILKIAYRSAMAILDKGLEEEKIVPKWLLNELEENGNYNNIISSLELVQST
ncbi:MAG: hypothetical protein V1801_02305 [Candidatus Falkowbacteria bacterium]